MTDINDIIKNITTFFNNRTIKFVIGGSYAIKQYCEMFSIENNIHVNNIDIFYLENTPITPEYIHTYRRVQSAPCSSMTYLTEDGFNINISMCRINSISYINYNNIKFMHPIKLLSYYKDDFDFDIMRIHKINIIETVFKKVYDWPVQRIIMNNINKLKFFPKKNFDGIPLARRLFLE